jgi:ubiquinone/menaquinone biosynthesis C-methylase UbiE
MSQGSIPERRLREEFNRWAEEGRGEEMEAHHRPITGPVLGLMQLRRDERVLDLGCGSGWLSRQVAALAPEGSVLGADVSDEMVRRAERASRAISNVSFCVGSAEKIPAEDGSFSRVISVESAYYWPDPAQGLAEIFRVLAPGGSAWILINYYRDNPHCHQWGAQYTIPAHLLWAEEWAELFRRAGFIDIAHRRIPDNSPTPEAYDGRWFRDAEQMRLFKREGALLITGAKPASRAPDFPRENRTDTPSDV